MSYRDLTDAFGALVVYSVDFFTNVSGIAFLPFQLRSNVICNLRVHARMRGRLAGLVAMVE